MSCGNVRSYENAGNTLKIVFVNRFFYPDQSATSVMLSDLLEGLDTSAQECLVITSASIHTPGEDVEERDFEDVDVVRVPGFAKGNGSLATRLLNFLIFYLGVLVVGIYSIRRGDVVICLTDPPLISVPIHLVARLKRAHVINWLQDIYPEVATALGIGSPENLAIRAMRFFRDRSWKGAHTNVCIGAVMKQRVEERGVPSDRIRVIPNWTDEVALSPLPAANNPLRAEWGLPEDSVIVGYSGNLGRAHDIDTMLDAGRRLIAQGDRQLQFLFVGGGVKQALLPSVAAEPNIGPHFQVRGYRPRNQLQLSLAVADIHWLSLEPDLEGLIVPSKFYGAIAAGRPIIFIGDTNGEIARLLDEAECGKSFAKGDINGVANYIHALANDAGLRQHLGLRGRQYCEQHLTRDARIADWDELIAQVIESATASTAGSRPTTSRQTL